MVRRSPSRDVWRLPPALETTPTDPSFRCSIGMGSGYRPSGFPAVRAGAWSTLMMIAFFLPSAIVLVARLPDLSSVAHWPLPSGGAHGMDINHAANLLYVACDDG